MPVTRFVIALGSNRRGRHGGPVAEVRAALAAIGASAASPIVTSVPLGPSIRRFANAVAILDTDEMPLGLLARLKKIERDFGRRRGRRWGARVIDLDIVLWSGGVWAGQGLTIPHIAYRERGFVLSPLLRITPDWRDPLTGRTVRQLHARLTRRRPIPRSRQRCEGP